jgi:hypothetical protein
MQQTKVRGSAMLLYPESKRTSYLRDFRDLCVLDYSFADETMDDLVPSMPRKIKLLKKRSVWVVTQRQLTQIC